MTDPSDLEVLESTARELAEIVGSLLPSDFRFALVLVGRGSLTYVSDGNRDDVSQMLAELALIVKHRADAPPATPGHPAHTRGRA